MVNTRLSGIRKEKISSVAAAVARREDLHLHILLQNKIRKREYKSGYPD